MPSLLIDRQGGIWPSASPDLLAAYDTPRSGGEFAEYAIANLGFIAMSEFGRSIAIKLRPELVSPKAIEGCLTWLQPTKYLRYVLENASGPNVELHTSRQTLEKSLYAIGVRPDEVQVQDYLIEKSKRPVKPAVVQLQEALRANPLDFKNPVAMDALSKSLQSIFGDRYIAAQADDGISPMVFSAVGREIFSAFDEWTAQAVGTPVEFLPDKDYGQWISEGYREAISEGDMTHENIDVIVKWPKLGRLRRRYNRIIVPSQGPNGEQQLISGTTLDQSIDLRVERVVGGRK